MGVPDSIRSNENKFAHRQVSFRIATTTIRMFHLHPIPFFVVTLALFSVAALLGLWLRGWRDVHIEPEEFSVKTLLGASLGLFGVLLGFTFSMANSRFEERRQLEIAEASDLQVVWLRSSFLTEPARSAERSPPPSISPGANQIF
jgi:hypothetical protein